MLDINSLMFTEFFKLHSVQKCFVNTVGNPAAEGRCVVIFLRQSFEPASMTAKLIMALNRSPTVCPNESAQSGNWK
jgi:hypothetical protein